MLTIFFFSLSLSSSSPFFLSRRASAQSVQERPNNQLYAQEKAKEKMGLKYWRGSHSNWFLLDHESTFIKLKGPQTQVKAQESQSPRRSQAQDSETSSRIREERIRGQGLDSTPPRPLSPRPPRPTRQRPSRPLSPRPQYLRSQNLGIEGSNSFEFYVMWSYPSNSNIKYLETRNQIHYLQEFKIQTP